MTDPKGPLQFPVTASNGVRDVVPMGPAVDLNQALRRWYEQQQSLAKALVEAGKSGDQGVIDAAVERARPHMGERDIRMCLRGLDVTDPNAGIDLRMLFR